MTNYRFGAVVLVNFQQLGASARKQRPGIVVLDIDDADLVIAPVTSKARTLSGDLEIANLSGTGLVRNSWVRLAKVATLLKSDVIRTLGCLIEAEQFQVAQTWASLYGEFVQRGQ